MQLLVVACSGKERPFADEVVPLGATGGAGAASAAPPGAGAPGAANPAPGEGLEGSPGLLAPPVANGAGLVAGSSCTSSTDCSPPGQCVDGVCCSSACTELCASCNVPGTVGTCSAAPSDEACPALACAGFDTECRNLDRTQLPLNCEAFGSCKAQADCATLPAAAGTPCQAGAGACDGSGACVVAGKTSLGGACAADADCAEGHCIPGPNGTAICCDAACDGPCQACSGAGRCELAPLQDERCEAVACPPDDACRDYRADVTASQCRAFGQCQTGRDCAFTALRPEAECVCDAATGACRLLPGATCAVGEECQSGACAANGQGTAICCAAACGEGLFCSSDGGACVACEGNAVECEGNTLRRCESGTIVATDCPNGCTPGIGCNSLPPLGFPCDNGQCAAPNVCQPDVTGASRCCSRNCAAENKVCAESGSCVCEAGQVAAGDDCLLATGDACQNSQDCQPGLTCTDGVCCQEACNGTCERCEPNTGLCVAVAAGQQDTVCGNGRQCTGTRGDCRSLLRQPCSGNGAECTSNNCEPTVGNATQICCSGACGTDRPFCRSDGNSCVQCETNADCGNGCNVQTGLCNALLAVGALCGSSSQCAAGAACILDQSSLTRCCESNCGARGLVCGATGRCVVPTVGVGQACTVGVVNCAGNLQCINNTCQVPTVGFGVACGEQASCDGRLGLECINAACDCPDTETFADGRCALNDGQPCQAAGDCAAGICTRWLADGDGDGFGSEPTVNGHPAVSICGDNSESNRPPPFVGAACNGGEREVEYVADSQGRTDCCDNTCPGVALNTVSSATAFPGQRQSGTTPANCAPGVFTLDFNCDGQVSLLEPLVPDADVRPACSAAPTAISLAECNQRSGFFTRPAACGVGRSRQTCVIRNGECAPAPAAPPPPELPSCL